MRGIESRGWCMYAKHWWRSYNKSAHSKSHILTSLPTKTTITESNKLFRFIWPSNSVYKAINRGTWRHVYINHIRVVYIGIAYIGIGNLQVDTELCLIYVWRFRMLSKYISYREKNILVLTYRYWSTQNLRIFKKHNR